MSEFDSMYDTISKHFRRYGSAIEHHSPSRAENITVYHFGSRPVITEGAIDVVTLKVELLSATEVRG